MTIRWDESTLAIVQAGAGYGRMVRLRERPILCAYSLRGVVFVRKSVDNGRTWQPAVRVADFAFGRATNAELLQRVDGDVLVFFNQRPTDRVHAYAIAMTTSQDDGATWSRPRVLYRAGKTRRTGCWEPAAVQLPSGEIQLFFANESPYPKSEEQEITMLRSLDGGRSWQPPRRVAFRPGYRDGMPVPLVLRDGRGIVLAIEDNGLNGRFKPAIIHTSLDRSWSHPSIGADSPNRRGALAEPLPDAVYAGAPYIRQFPSGETVLSVQSGEGRPRSGVHDNARMVVYVGDAGARNFRNESVPFDLAPEDSGLWNSLFIKDAHTVTAISEARIDGVRGLWAIDGHLVAASKK